MVELQKSLVEAKILKSILPICSSCKKIRDDKGDWQQIETYLQAHSEIKFTHGICPDCLKNLYPDLVSKEKKPKGQDLLKQSKPVTDFVKIDRFS